MTSSQKPTSKIASLLWQNIPRLLLILGLLPLAAWAYMGSFARYLADDYSTSSILIQQGFWQAQGFWYQSWSGRYSFTFLISLVELLSVKVVPWLPFVSLLAWFLSLFWALKQIFRLLNIPLENKWLGILTSVILFGTVKGFRDYSQVIFWQTGILTYQISIIFFGFFLALFLQRFFLQAVKSRPAVWEYVVFFIAAFLVGGFSETWISIQVAIITLSLLYFIFLYKDANRNDILGALLAACLGSWCSLVAIVKAPGNLGRNSSLAGLSLQSLSASFISSVQDTPLFLIEWMRDNTALMTMLLLAGVFVGFFAVLPIAKDKIIHYLRLGFSLLLLSVGLLSVGFFPSYVAWGVRPPDRAIFIPMFIFVWVYVLLGVFVGYSLNSYFTSEMRRKYAQGFMLLSLVLAMYWMQIRTTLASIQLIPSLQAYVQLWDERDTFLRQAGAQGQKEVVIPSLRRNPAVHDLRPTIWILGELEENRHNWINEAAAAYYGLESITGK